MISAEAALAGIKDFFELRDHRLGRRVLDGENTDRLPAHPIRIEAQHGVDSGPPLDGIADDDDQVIGGIGANCAGFGGKPLKQLRDRLDGDVLKRNDGDAVAGLGRPDIGIVDAAGPCRLRRRYDAVTGGIFDENEIARAQRAFEREKDVALGYRTA